LFEEHYSKNADLFICRLVYELCANHTLLLRRLPTRRKMSRSLREISLAIRRSSSLSIIQELPHYALARSVGARNSFFAARNPTDSCAKSGLRSEHFVTYTRYLRDLILGIKRKQELGKRGVHRRNENIRR